MEHKEISNIIIDSAIQSLPNALYTTRYLWLSLFVLFLIKVGIYLQNKKKKDNKLAN